MRIRSQGREAGSQEPGEGRGKEGEAGSQEPGEAVGGWESGARGGRGRLAVRSQGREEGSRLQTHI